MNKENESVQELESQLAHLQRHVEVLNEVVAKQGSEIDQLNKRVEKWEDMVRRLKNSGEPMSDPLDEKPPHY